MHRNVVPMFVLILTLIFVVITFMVSFRYETGRLRQVQQIKSSPSRIYARMLIQYDKPPIYQEEWRMQDIEGVSTYDYRIRGYDGRQVTITMPPNAVHDVSYWWGKLDRDGIWQITNQPPRGDTSKTYTVYVKQIVDFKHGERTVTFTDPHYWATTAGRQYSIDLSKQNPSDLLKLQSTQLADPRYQVVVNDFLTFGPDEFRAKIAAQRAKFETGK